MSIEPGRPQRRRHFLTIVSTVLLLSIGSAGFLGYLFYAEGKRPEPPPPPKPPAIPSNAIQLDVLNGCGAKGAGARFTEYLRASGFDVVELRNYSSSSVDRTLVIDRVGNLAAARKVAEALGVGEAGVVQQLNPDYFVDVSVVIGGDHASLNPGKPR